MSMNRPFGHQTSYTKPLAIVQTYADLKHSEDIDKRGRQPYVIVRLPSARGRRVHLLLQEATIRVK